ncbi:hypothetical protein Tco_1346094 [Tanacetum coccineum]
MNQNFNYSNSFGLDQIQPSQFSTVQLLEIERINKEESFKKKDMSLEEIMSEKRLIDDEINDITNDLSYKRFRGEKIDDEYERDCEIKIKQLLQDYSGLDIEMRKKERVLMEEKYLAASQQPEESLIMGDEHLDTIPEKESDELIKSSVENLVPIPSEFEDFSDNEKLSVSGETRYFNPFHRELRKAELCSRGRRKKSDDDYDSEGDICFLEELLNNGSLLLPENESFSLDHFDDPSLPRPPPKPPDVEN